MSATQDCSVCWRRVPTDGLIPVAVGVTSFTYQHRRSHVSYAKTYTDLLESEVLPSREPFLAQVDIGADDECWFWMGYSSVHHQGYGENPLFEIGKRGSVRCQRIMWALDHQIAPANLRYVTTCGWDLCLNPKHLDAVEMDGEFVDIGGRECFIASTESETPGTQCYRQCA